MKNSNKKDVKNIIINKVINLIESKQKLPWHKPWYIPDSMNLLTGNKYRGINIWITSFADSPYFIGQADLKKYNIIPNKGSIGYPIVFYKPLIYLENKKITEIEYKSMPDYQQKKCKYIPMLRYYTSFNINDCNSDTLPDIIKKRLKKYTLNNHNLKIDIIEGFIKKHNPVINNSINASYIPSKDIINIPNITTFNNSESYYCTLLHELSHWTGAKNRLNREGIVNFDRFGSHKYGIEELIAELSASQLCRNMKININIDNSTAYIVNWIKALKNNPDMLFNASYSADEVIKYLEK